MQPYKHHTFMSLIHQSKEETRPNRKLLEFENHDLSISLSNHPKWPLTFSHATPYPGIQKTLESFSKHDLKASYQIKDGKWINYDGSPNFSYFHYILLFLGLIAILTLLIANFAFIHLVSSALKNMKSSARKLGLDMYTKIDDNKGLPMVHDTALTMKKMQFRIQDLVTHNAKLLGAISHDLRTPITRIKLRADLINDASLSDKIIVDAEEIEKMISELLSYTQNAAYKEKKKPVNMNGLLLITCYEFMDAGHHIETQGLETNIPYLIAKNSLKRCFNNILSNAFKFSDKVIVTSKKIEEQIIITIEDNGPGIPESELENVMKPFYRTQAGKKASSTGAGLGLAIVAEVMHYHQGDIQLLNRPEGGLCVRLTFN